MLTSVGGYFHAGDDDIAAGGTERTVDDKEVAVVDSLTNHRLALHLDEECGGGPLTSN